MENYKYSSYGEYVGEQRNIDAEDIFALISLECFAEIDHDPVAGEYLEISETKIVRMTDELASALIKEVSGCESIPDFQDPEKACGMII